MEDLSPGSYSDNQLRLKNWCDSNSSHIVVKKPAAFSLIDTDRISIVSDDRGLVNSPDHRKYGGLRDLTASAGSDGFVSEKFQSGDISLKQFQRFQENLETSSRATNPPSELLEVLDCQIFETGEDFDKSNSGCKVERSLDIHPSMLCLRTDGDVMTSEEMNSAFHPRNEEPDFYIRLSFSSNFNTRSYSFRQPEVIHSEFSFYGKRNEILCSEARRSGKALDWIWVEDEQSDGEIPIIAELEMDKLLWAR